MHDLLGTARRVVSESLTRGAGQVRLSMYRARHSSLEWRDGKVERLQQSTQNGLSVSLYLDGRYSVSSTSDLRPQALVAFLDEAVAMTRLLAPDAYRSLPDPFNYGNPYSGDLELCDTASLARLTTDEKLRIVRELEAEARSAPGADKVLSVTTGCANSIGESVLICSNGMEATRQSSSHSLWTGVSARGVGERKPEGWHTCVRRYFDDLEDLPDIARDATRRALASIGEAPLASGTYPFVLERNVTGRLLSGLVAPLSGRAIQQRHSFLGDRLEQTVASPVLTIRDEPHLVRGLGSRVHDAEGMSTHPLPIIEGGVLKNHYLDTYYAGKLQRPPTTGTSTNLVFPAGQQDLDGILQTMERGVLITGFTGGNFNPATGDFSLGVRGQWIEHGQPARPLAEMNLSGNHKQLWNSLISLGSDINPNSAWRCPSLLFGPTRFSGI